MIETMEEFRKASFRPSEHSTHMEWRPWRDVLQEASPEFKKLYLRKRAERNRQYDCELTRRAVKVTTRKYKARKKRKRR